MQLTVIIPTHNTRDLTLRCLETLEPALDRLEGKLSVASRVVVVDDASSDGSAKTVQERFPQTLLLRNDKPRGFTGSITRALESIQGQFSTQDDLVLLLNSDTEVEIDAISELIAPLSKDPRLGIVGASLYYSDGRAQWSGGKEPTPLWLLAQATGLPERWSKRSAIYRRMRARLLRAGRPLDQRTGTADGTGTLPVAWVPGAALLIRGQLLQQLGGLDPDYRFFAQDLDLCSRARKAGYTIAIASASRVLHHLGASGSPEGNSEETDRDPSAEAQRLGLLWLDLLLWCRKHRSPRKAGLCRFALLAGARMGILVDLLVAGQDGGCRSEALEYATSELGP